MEAARSHTDAWTYYEFGTRSFGDQIRALILNHFDQPTDCDAILPQLTVKPGSGTLPIIPVLLERVPLEDQPTDPGGVCRVTKVVLPVDLEKDRIAVAYLSQYPELVTKLKQAIAREIALNCFDAIFFSGDFHGTIPISADSSKVFHSLGPY